MSLFGVNEQPDAHPLSTTPFDARISRISRLSKCRHIARVEGRASSNNHTARIPINGTISTTIGHDPDRPTADTTPLTPDEVLRMVNHRSE
jgi:hypothetical protein